VIDVMGITVDGLIREMTTSHRHDFTKGWGQPGHCMCGGWKELVDALVAAGIPADRMSMDPLLRQWRAVARGGS